MHANPYLETYLTIAGNSVKYLPKKTGLQASVTLTWEIFKENDIIKKLSYNLWSPLTKDSINFPSFIDNQRFSLPNGQYTLKFSIVDNALPNSVTTHTENITVLFHRDKKIETSDIQILESFSKSNGFSTFSKNGYDLIPYTVNYFPASQNLFKFYFESYNADTLFGKNSKFIYTYYLEDNETLKKVNHIAGFRKQKANWVNPLLAQFDITSLPSGNYNLVIELRDSVNIMHAQKKYFFQRQSDFKSVANEQLENTTIDLFFHSIQSTDTLKEFIECLWPISKTTDRTWQQTQLENKNNTNMQNYLIEYWKSYASDSLDPLTVCVTYLKDVKETNAMFKCGMQKGYYTDRGRVYLQYGKPNQRNQVNSSPNTYPYEVWQYYRIFDKTTKHFFTNKKFVFVNFAIADDCYELLYSDVRGEKIDPNWKFRLVKRMQKQQNVDDNSPIKTYGNNFEDDFINPR
jgi:GWxTD domain-containing protein